MRRWYLMPGIVEGTERRAKYLTSYAAMEYGENNVFLCSAEVTIDEHLAISSNADVVAFPINLDGTVGANVTALSNALEDFNIPADWVSSGLTWRQTIKGIALLFQIASRWFGLFRETFFTNLALETQYNALPQQVRNRLLLLANDLNLETSGIVGTMTMRQILGILRPQLRHRIHIGGEEI